MADRVTLRPAGPEDAYALWVWANDEDTRKASFGRDPIAWGDHLRWLGRALADPARVVTVAEVEDGLPVGSIRFDSDDRWATARLSYVIAPESRGQGLAGEVVRAGVRWIRGTHPAAAIRATVMSANPRSLRVFRNPSWREAADEDGMSTFWFIGDTAS